MSHLGVKLSKSSAVTSRKIAVVIPAFRVTSHILQVIDAIGPEVDLIYVVDDKCPDLTADHVENNCTDNRVIVLRNEENLGVGGAVKSGYQRAISDNAEIIVKLDGDGQMNPDMIPRLIEPLLLHYADYSKGNRFNNIEDIKKMPKVRIFGNLVLSFLSKFSTGYWRVFDPTNGFTAITRDALSEIPLSKISNRYFFESDMLFRLNIARCKVTDVAMPAIYGSEKSNLKITRTILEFPLKHLRNFLKRIFYTYYLRDFSITSIELPAGIILAAYSVFSSIVEWNQATRTSFPTPTGTLLLISISILASIQLLLNCLNHDIQNSSSLCVDYKSILRRRA